MMAREFCSTYNGVYFTLAPVLFGLVFGRYQPHNFQIYKSSAQQRTGQPNVCNGPAGYKADVLTGCETYYYCHTDGLKEAFACPFGMLFDERRGQCDTWNNVNCPVPGQQAQQNLGIFGSGPEGSPPMAPVQQSQLYPASSYSSYPSPPPPSLPNSNSINPVPSANMGPNNGANAMDFLAALLFPPLSGQHDLNDFVNTAPSGVRQSFMRVAGEGQLTPNQYTPYAEPLGPGGGNQLQRPVYQEQTGVEGAIRRETPGSSAGGGARRVLRPSPAMNPMDAMAMENGATGASPYPVQNSQPLSYGSGPVPPHLMGGHSSYMFGQLNMLQQQNQSGLPLGGPLSGAPLGPVAGLTPSAQVEALRPLWQSLMRNPYQPHLRRMASLIAGGTAMDMGLVNGKMVTDPLGAAAPDPALATSKKNKALDDGLVDAR